MTPTEMIVAEIFRDVFRTRNITPDSDFFDLGGESHKAITIALLLEDEFAVELPVDLIEEVTSVKGLAAWLDARRHG